MRRQFPHFPGSIYFNHGAISILPMNVLKACVEGVKLGAVYSLGGREKREWLAIREETREMSSELIGASPRNIAFVANTSTALSLISLAIPWRKGDNVVTASVENPATVVPWQNLKHLGVEVRYLPADRDDLIDLDALPGLIDRRTRLVALSLVQYSTGQRMDLRRVVDLCRRRGILVSADAVQAVGAVPVDVKALGVNFLAAGAQKWLMGPLHVAMMYADDRALGLCRSPIVTEDNVPDIVAEEQEATSGIPSLHINEGALMFEASPYHNFAGVCGLHQSLKNIRAMGKANLYRRLHEVTSELVERLGGLDGRVVSPRGEGEWSGIVSFAPRGADPKEIVRRLRRKGVYIAMRKGRLRICPHYYNTSAEVKRFVSLLREASV